LLKIAVVTPTYNEADNLPILAQALFALPLDVRLLVVDDNSPDGTGAVADQLAAEHPGRVQVLHRAGKLGFSSAYLEGFQLALDGGSEAVAQMDADFSHDPQVLPAMIEKLQDCDMVLDHATRRAAASTSAGRSGARGSPPSAISMRETSWDYPFAM